jgi:FkbM family methyltransferase
MQIKGVDGRHGRFNYFADDTYVGRSLNLYGEYSEAEAQAVGMLIKAGDVVVEVGSNIGALTVPMSHIIGPEGVLHSYEPQPSTATLLRENLTENCCDNVVVHQAAAGDSNCRVKMTALNDLMHNNFGAATIGDGKVTVSMEKIDDLQLKRLNLLKIDAEGSERQVLLGAEETIRRCRPMIYVENDRREKSDELIGTLVDMGYRLYWHRPFLYNPNNFLKHNINVFGAIVSINMLCVPTDVKDEKGYFEVNGLDEVTDTRVAPDMYQREEKRYRIEMAHHPKDLTARLLVAHYLSCQQRSDEARQLIDENLAINPNHAPTLHIAGMMDLQQGKYDTGWDRYEQRYNIKDRAHFGGDRAFNVAKWDGEPTDKIVLIWCEQGYGDNIMFVRFMDKVLALAPNAILETQPQLYELFELSGIRPLYRRMRTLPHYDLHCSLPSLPATLKLYSEKQLRSDPYLKAEPNMMKVWDTKLSQHPRPRIGICYRGSPRSERPWSRDMDYDLLQPIIQKYGPVVDLTQQGQFESFADSAACISALDVVLTVDTSVAHLSGALGVPTWLMLSTDPDFRWGLKSEQTCWYDTMRIFRQEKFLDWSGVLEQIAAELENMQHADAKLACLR